MYRAGQDLKLLDPSKVQLHREQQKTEGLCLEIKNGSEQNGMTYTDVSVHLMFPLTHPDSLITLCDRTGEEIGVLIDFAKLDDSSRQALVAELQMSYFVPKITRIKGIKEEFGIVHWEVDTNHGAREFDVQSRYDIRPMGRGRFVVRDMDGNRYDIPNAAELDGESRNLLELEV